MKKPSDFYKYIRSIFRIASPKMHTFTIDYSLFNFAEKAIWILIPVQQKKKYSAKPKDF